MMAQSSVTTHLPVAALSVCTLQPVPTHWVGTFAVAELGSWGMATHALVTEQQSIAPST